MDPEKFAKVLALAESDHHGEAQSALRAARIMLGRAGLSFRDLARLARESGGLLAPPPSPPRVVEAADSLEPAESVAERQALRLQIQELETKLLDLEETVVRQRTELARQRQEAKRWHKLARETAEKLWDVGKALESRHARAQIIDKRRAVVEALRDPATIDWCDNEIARRVGVPPRAVGYWRRRLALAAHTHKVGKVEGRSRRLNHLFYDRVLTDGIRRG
ncbi:MAG: hypothetical protein WCF85_20990 [Rhodospirillaceae bacterium]